MSAFALRKASERDIPAMVELVNSAYRGDDSRIGWTTEADLLGGQRTDPITLHEQLDSPGAEFLLHESSAGLLACVYLQRRESPGGVEAYLGMLTVRPTSQASGLGSALLIGAERHVRDEWRATALRMTVIAQRAELIAWYARRGYTDTGLREAFPYGDPRFGLPKRDDLFFRVLAKQL